MRPKPFKIIIGLSLWLGGLALLISLCVWQIQRLEWKQGILTELAAAQKAEPQPLTQLINQLTNNQLAFRNTIFNAEILDKPALKLIRSKDGKPGHVIVTFARLTDATAFNNYHVVLLAGWQTMGTKVPAFKPQKLSLHGMIRRSQKPTWLTKNDPTNDVWQSLYIDEMAAHNGLKPYLPFAVALDQPLDGLQPLPPTPPISNNHTQYAWTWGSMAVIWLVMGILFIRKQF